MTDQEFLEQDRKESDKMIAPLNQTQRDDLKEFLQDALKKISGSSTAH